MSIGIRLHDLEKGALEQRAAIAKAQGFCCVHLALSKTLSPERIDPAGITAGFAAEITGRLQGLRVAVLGCYLNLAHPDEAAYGDALAKYEGQLLLAKWMNAALVGTETGNPNAEYRYDPAHSHSDEALRLFIRRLRPVVNAAEKLGQLIAIEPVYTHIVSDPFRARRVLDEIASPNLKIIFDPVNLLHPDNLSRRTQVLEAAMTLLKNEIAVVHLKDYTIESDRLKACAVGEGAMDYRAVMQFLQREKPGIDITLENTAPHNAVKAREAVERMMGESLTGNGER